MNHLTEAWSRVAMPMNPPPDLEFHRLEGQFMGRGPTVAATSGGQVIGHMTLILEGRTLYDQEWVVDMVYVVPEWRRKGIASLLFNEAVKIKPDLRHSGYRSPQGEAWARARSEGTAPKRIDSIPQAKVEKIGEAARRIIQADLGDLMGKTDESGAT